MKNSSTENFKHGIAKPVLANRLFKLRAWVRNEIMVNVVSIDFNNEFITWDDNQYDRCVPPNKCYEIETFDDIVLMQFTGFKDFEEKEIYEGDILEYVSYMRDENKRKEIVEFDEKCGGWYVHKQADTLSDVLFKQHSEEWQLKQNYKPSIKHKVRVIGNIYENPELTQTTS